MGHLSADDDDDDGIRDRTLTQYYDAADEDRLDGEVDESIYSFDGFDAIKFLKPGGWDATDWEARFSGLVVDSAGFFDVVPFTAAWPIVDVNRGNLVVGHVGWFPGSGIYVPRDSKTLRGNPSDFNPLNTFVENGGIAYAGYDATRQKSYEAFSINDVQFLAVVKPDGRLMHVSQSRITAAIPADAQFFCTGGNWANCRRLGPVGRSGDIVARVQEGGR